MNMDDRILKNYRRFSKYTLKLGLVLLVVGIVLLIFEVTRWIGAVCLVASVSALIHSEILKIMSKNLK